MTSTGVQRLTVAESLAFTRPDRRVEVLTPDGTLVVRYLGVGPGAAWAYEVDGIEVGSEIAGRLCSGEGLCEG